MACYLSIVPRERSNQEFEAWILFRKDWRTVHSVKVACAHGPCIFALIKSRENTFNFFPFSLSFFPPFSSLPANFPEKSRGKWCSWLRFRETVVFSGVSRVEINRFEGNRVIFFVSHFVKCHSLIRRGKMEKFHERWLNMS